MARKKEEPKPLLTIKHDFVDSLENFTQKGMILLQAAEFAVKYGGDDMPTNIRLELEKSAKAFRDALFSEGGNE